jgi:hypothetical protein
MSKIYVPIDTLCLEGKKVREWIKKHYGPDHLGPNLQNTLDTIFEDTFEDTGASSEFVYSISEEAADLVAYSELTGFTTGEMDVPKDTLFILNGESYTFDQLDSL